MKKAVSGVVPSFVHLLAADDFQFAENNHECITSFGAVAEEIQAGRESRIRADGAAPARNLLGLSPAACER